MSGTSGSPTSDEGTQLALDVEPAQPNPNAWMFHADGSPKRLLWCSDTVRIAFHRGEPAPCPYTEPHPRSRVDTELLPPIGIEHRPPGGCCKDIAG